MGLSLGLTLWNLGAHEDGSKIGHVTFARVTAEIVAVSVVAVAGLVARDAVQRRRTSEGQPVRPILRLFLASGNLSAVLWLGAAFGSFTDRQRLALIAASSTTVPDAGLFTGRFV